MVTIIRHAASWPNGHSIPLKDFPRLLGRHWSSDPTTPCIEAYAAKYVAARFPKDRTIEFVRHVCRWARDNRRAGKVIKNNTPAYISSQFEATYDALLRNDIQDAIRQVTAIYGLSVSFGSKHLKFLHPERAVVLDKIIRGALGYRDSSEGFEEFLNDCITIRDTLDRRIIPIDHTRPRWRVSDVEMAIFANVKPI